MRLLSDEEMFIHYPRPGIGIQNELPNPPAYNLRTAFDLAFIKHDFPETVHFEGTGYSEKQVRNSLNINRKSMLGGVFYDAFIEIDIALEKYMDASKGYIGEFPNPNHAVYDHPFGIFNYFTAPTKKVDPYLCPYEERLNYACQELKDSTAARFFRHCLAGGISVLLLILALILNPVLSALPQFTAFLRSTPVACYIFLACLVVPLEIVGLLTPLQIMKKRFEYSQLYYKALVGVAIGYCFVGNLYPFIMIGTINYFTIFLRWALVLYLIALVIFYIRHISKEYPVYQEALQKVSKAKARIITLYEENAEKLHRYVRLRKLWYEDYRNDVNATSEWLTEVEARVQMYAKLYEEFKHPES